MMMPLVKLESEAEASTWQRFCSEIDIRLMGSRQAGEEGRLSPVRGQRQRAGDGEPTVSS